MAYFEQTSLIDATTLFSGTIAATGAGTSIDTTSYGSLVFQMDGSGTVQAVIEGSTDGTNWDILTLTSGADIAPVDVITSIDTAYYLKTGHKFVRLNVSYYTGTITVTVLGRAGPGPTAADNVALAFDPNNPLNVKVQNKSDQTGALMLSDAPVPVIVNAVVGTTTIIDMQGYSTLNLTTGAGFAATAGFQISNDQLNWAVNQAVLSSIAAGPTVMSTTIAALSSYAFSATARFVRIVCTTAGTFTYYLRNTPGVMSAQNLTAIAGAAVSATVAQLGMNIVNVGGTGVVTGGVLGLLGVGGNIAAGTAPTANPVPVGTADFGTLTRRLLSDVSGRAMIAAASPLLYTMAGTTTTTQNTPSSNTALPHMSIGMLPHTYQQTGAMNVQDTSQNEGQNFVELLAQILLELKILNQQMYELPIRLTYSNPGADSPETYRNDPTFFNINNT